MSDTALEPGPFNLSAGPGHQPYTVEAIQPQPGLYVYRYPEDIPDQDPLYRWRLGHHSGFSIAKFEYPGDAQDAAWYLRDVADWTAEADALRAQEGLGDKIRDLIYDTPGVFMSRPDTAKQTTPKRSDR
ncbi:hypothetical protein [Streptomyces sp. Wb2n-11]|uniref:hypothetical protein n=1 Tax=Streptomyces sp. Wb2n-11 TaxID=1030533 RepID=UPI000AEDE866|nr:hypothetical protein [Streptomyces sp. Wb2n-11]